MASPKRSNSTIRKRITVPRNMKLLRSVLKSPIRVKITRLLLELENAGEANNTEPTLSNISRLTGLNKRTASLNLAGLEKEQIVKSTYETREIRGRPMWVKIYRIKPPLAKNDLHWLLELIAQ